ncbi:hypothetical protein [Fusibacter ferrireducens]|uniref:Uncharacterized protein n=1 Tax=Fusibacter ferrireducens TaxID=2785058 RepID=A0ABR9ZP92_9FIRM|nr:hypothetical protein [Fusibacter ferrireducens]MBF4692229.1 hypothetical protein [Fusibacter ferrireducens]
MGFLKKFKQGATDAIKMYDKVKTNKKLTYDELYEIMKDGTYSIGVPEIKGSGIMRCIKFPPVDKYLVQVAVTGTTITITRVYSGVEGFAKEAMGNALTDGMYDVLNKENIDLNRATREVGEVLSGLLGEKGLLKDKP